MNQLLALTSILTLLSSTLPGADEPDAEKNKVPEISIANLEKEIAKGTVILLDVNGSKYFAKGHISGAIDFRAHEADLASVLGKDKSRLLVVYCGGPQCEAYETGVEAAKELGFTNIRHLPEGISGWIAAGKPTGPPS